jgi:hypothetical protein
MALLGVSKRVAFRCGHGSERGQRRFESFYAFPRRSGECRVIRKNAGQNLPGSDWGLPLHEPVALFQIGYSGLTSIAHCLMRFRGIDSVEGSFW